MKAQFFDRQNTDNPLSGAFIENLADLRGALERGRGRPPFFAELIGDNGFALLLGVGELDGCAQFSSVDGEPPYLMAVAQHERGSDGDLEFLIDGTPSAAPKRYCLPYRTVECIAAVFIATGQRDSDVDWEEI